MNQDFLTATPGEPVSAEKWNQMERAAASNQVLMGGDNTRNIYTPHGTLINSKHAGGWDHPWRVLTSSTVAILSPGTINGEYPSIVDPNNEVIRIDTEPRPHLDMVAPKLGPNNVGWIALELQLTEDYRTIHTAYIVQCDFIVGSELATTNPFFFFGLPGIGDFKVRYPLARIHYRSDTQSITIFQVAMFNLNHICKPPAQTTRQGEPAQSTLPRHFFFPA